LTLSPGARPSGRFNVAGKLMKRLIFGLATLKRRKRRAPRALLFEDSVKMRPATKCPFI
jgi:hypothetical protein